MIKITLETLKINDVKFIVLAIKNEMYDKMDYLTKLDSVVGDGDLGLTMCNSLDFAWGSINEYEGQDVGEAILQAGLAMSNAAGTIGILFATATMRAGKVVRGKKEIALKDLVGMGFVAIEAIQYLGKAKVGDKTVLDSLVPAVEALKKGLEVDLSLPDAFKVACETARAGVEKTKDMASQFGRAHYYGEKSRGKKDPGAAVVTLIVDAIYAYLKKNDINPNNA